MPAVVAPRPGKAVRKDAAFQILAKRLADIRLWGVVVALAVELTSTCQRVPGLEVFGNRLVEQRALGMARVVELGFGSRLTTASGCASLRRRCGDGGHGAVPAWAGCQMIPGLYLASPRAELIIGCARYS